MVPGAAFSTGSVPPAIWRNAAMARGPSRMAATTGPEVMNSSSDAEEGLALVFGVVLAGEIVVDVLELEGRDAQAFAFDPAENLSDQLALNAVGLDQRKGPLSHGRQPSRATIKRRRRSRVEELGNRDQSGGGCWPGSRPRFCRRSTSARR